MSMIIGGVLPQRVALFGDSATSTKVISIPQLKLALGWAGTFHRSPANIVNPTEPEFLDPARHPNYPGVQGSIRALIDHINTLDHIHGGGTQALLFVAAYDTNVQRLMAFETTAGRGGWPAAGTDLPAMFIAGCLEPFGIHSAWAHLNEPVQSLSRLADLGLAKIEYSQRWLQNNGRVPIVRPPLTGYMISTKGFTYVSRT